MLHFTFHLLYTHAQLTFAHTIHSHIHISHSTFHFHIPYFKLQLTFHISLLHFTFILKHKIVPNWLNSCPSYYNQIWEFLGDGQNSILSRQLSIWLEGLTWPLKDSLSNVVNSIKERLIVFLRVWIRVKRVFDCIS